jgi:methylmalonyl-CoA/ethylmalonyl-CoA epimerase
MTMTFHHVGVACRDLDAETEAFGVLGYQPEGVDFVDDGQGIRGRFMVGPGPRLELLVGLPGSSVLEPWLDKGIKFYHQAFVVESLSASLQELRGEGNRMVSPPTPAVAFGGRHIAFVVLRNMAMVELIQQENHADG